MSQQRYRYFGGEVLLRGRQVEDLFCRAGNRVTISSGGADLRVLVKIIFWMLGAGVLHAQAPLSEWAFGGADHRLHYQFDARGNSIMDFSAAGYRAGGVKLPSAAIAQRLTPAAGDNKAHPGGTG